MSVTTLTMQKLLGVPDKGHALPNGAIVLDSVIQFNELHEEGRYYYGLVLAMHGGEFIVWRLGVRPDSTIETWNGNYFSTIQQAVEFYGKKVQGS